MYEDMTMYLLQSAWNVVVCESEEESETFLSILKERLGDSLSHRIDALPLYTGDGYYRITVMSSNSKYLPKHGPLDYFEEYAPGYKQVRYFCEFADGDTFGQNDPPVEWLLGMEAENG